MIHQFTFSDRLSNMISKAVSFIEGNKSVPEERFKYEGQIRSRDGDLGGRPIGSTFLDKKTGLTLFFEGDFYTDKKRERDLSGKKGPIIERPACFIKDISILLSRPEEIGGTVDEREFRACLKHPQTAVETKAEEALYEKFWSYYATSPSRIFVDRTGRADSQRTLQGTRGLAQLAFN